MSDCYTHIKQSDRDLIHTKTNQICVSLRTISQKTFEGGSTGWRPVTCSFLKSR